MRFSAPAFLTGLLALTIGADARSSTGDRVLLVVDKEDAGQFKGEGSYTKFLESLECELGWLIDWGDGLTEVLYVPRHPFAPLLLATLD